MSQAAGSGSVVLPPVPIQLQTFLALDFGMKRTGFAVGNRLLRTAQPQGTLVAEGKARFDKVAQQLKTWQPDALVVGVPYPTLVAAECQLSGFWVAAL